MYTEDIRSDINRFFRYKPELFKYIDISDKQISLREFFSFMRNLDKLTVNHCLTEDTILYRGCNNDKKAEKIIKRGRFIEKGYCSTTFDKDVAKNFTINLEDDTIGWLIEVYAPKGTHGVFIHRYSYYPDEIEFLLPRNSEFNIFKHDKNTKTMKILFLKYL